MSRSYKKNHIIKYAGDKEYKKLFNRKLRRVTSLDEIPNGKAYKKMNESWDIDDIRSYCSWEDYKEICKWRGQNEDELYNEWKKCYLRK